MSICKASVWSCSTASPARGLRMPEAASSGEPDAGNPHVRFDEGRGDVHVPLLLYGLQEAHFEPRP
jgi:hypothetical protein